MKTIHGTWNDSSDAVTLIDAHHHLWDLSMKKHPNRVSGVRHDFFMGDDSAINRDYLPADYRRDAAGHNVLTTVHCEAEWARDDQLVETRWVTAMHERYGIPGAIVARLVRHTKRRGDHRRPGRQSPRARHSLKAGNGVRAGQDGSRGVWHDAG